MDVVERLHNAIQDMLFFAPRAERDEFTAACDEARKALAGLPAAVIEHLERVDRPGWVERARITVARFGTTRMATEAKHLDDMQHHLWTVPARNSSTKFKPVYRKPIPSKPMQKMADEYAEQLSKTSTPDKTAIARKIAPSTRSKAETLRKQFATLLDKNRVTFEPVS